MVARRRRAPARARPPAPWRIPAGWKRETIPFPLEFAPSLAHRGAEELRFAPGFFAPDAPGYWSYTFAWRTEDPAALDADALGAELTAYFRGLIAAVDEAGKITARDAVALRAIADGARFAITGRVFDPFRAAKTGEVAAVELAGWAARTPCGDGALWVFVLAPPASPLRAELDAVAADARCGQPSS